MSGRARWWRPGAALIAVALGGCTLARPAPVINHYTIPGAAAQAAVSAPVPVVVGQIDALPPFQQTGIAYQLSPYQLDNYRLNQWVAAPTWMLRARMQELIVPQPGQQLDSRPPLQLDARIFAFQQVIDGDSSSGRVEIRFCLRPPGITTVPLWCKTIRDDQAAGGQTPESAAQAIGTAFNQVLAELHSDLNQELAAGVGGGGPVVAWRRHPR